MAEPVIFKPVLHIKKEQNISRNFYTPSLHSYVQFTTNTNRKKKVSWKDTNVVGFTFSKHEYDRKIDNRQIKDNIEEKRKFFVLKKTPPIIREPSVFTNLNELNFENY